MKKIVSFLLVAIMLLGVSLTTLTSCDILDKLLGGDKEPMVDPIADNYRTFYQIFVGSFADANGDGFGDIRGIINNFDYLNDGDINSGNDLGVQGIWLSPIFASPSYHKYDAKDYYKLDWRFGEEKDLVELLNLCHSRNVKLILDLAINHTSTQHDWFIKFKEARMNGDTSNKYYDYYSCTTTAGKLNGHTYQKIAMVDCWYECNFSGDMPELNYDNPEVRQAVLDVAKYYLDLGIDGFRFDAVKYIYYGDTTRSVAFWEWYMKELRAYKPDIYTVGECWSGDNEVVKYYGAMNCFNFTVSSGTGRVAQAAKGIDSVFSYASYLENYQKMIEKANPDAMVMSFLSNHDQDRIAGAFFNEINARMAANLYLLAPGSPVIYYGEELGMKGSRGSELTDANRRLAMLWGNDYTPRNPVGSTYPADKQIKTTAMEQIEDKNSMYNHYARVIAVRHRYPAIARGNYTAISCGNNKLGGFLVEYNGEYLVIIHNTSGGELSYDLTRCSALSGKGIDEICDYVGTGKATLNGNLITVPAYTSIILK
jgi:glycosidase